MDRSSKTWLLVIVPILAVIAVWLILTHRAAVRVGEPNEPVVVRAAEAVDRFHAGVNEERYQEVCLTAEPGAFAGVTELPCANFLAYLRQKLGTAMVAKRVQSPIVENVPSGAKVHVSLSYETGYQNGTAREHFEWRINGPQVSLTSYKVDADALSR